MVRDWAENMEKTFASYMLDDIPLRELLMDQIQKSLEVSKRLNLKSLWGE